MKTPLVSVIIPNYNHAKYLDQRLQTVLNQTYKNFEVIILDDKSIDNSLEIIKKYSDDSHIKHIIVNKENSGSPFKQWDKGIKIANGELIWIAESDDYNELNFLSEIVKEWNKYRNVVVAFSSYVMFTDEWAVYPKELKTRCFKGTKFIKYRMARTNHLMNASGVVFKKDVYNQINKDFLNYRSLGDYIFWVHILENGNVITVKKNLTYYRQTVGSVTRTCWRNGISDKEDKKIFDYINNTFSLSKWQQKMAYASKFEQYQKKEYASENVRQEIYSLWEKNKHSWVPHPMLKWFIAAMERHCGILL